MEKLTKIRLGPKNLLYRKGSWLVVNKQRSWTHESLQSGSIYKMCDHWHVFAKISKGFREHQELLKFFSFLPLTSLFVCFCFSKRNPIEYRHFVFQNNVFKRSKQKIGKLSACLPLYFAGTSRAYFPPSRSSVAVFPVEHKGTCWRKTLAAHWEDGPFGQVRYKHKDGLLFSLLFPVLSLLIIIIIIIIIISLFILGF